MIRVALSLVALGMTPAVASPLYAGAHASMSRDSGFFYVNADAPAYLDIYVHIEYVNPQQTIVDDSPGTYGTYWQSTYGTNCAGTGRYNSTESGEVSVSASNEAGVAYGYDSSESVCGGRDDYPGGWG
jgi:hypothetical protein